MKVLVTGASGYIGSHVVDELLSMGIEVVALDVAFKDRPKNATIIETSIFDNDINIFEKVGKPDVCIHLAWRNGFAHNEYSHIEDLSAHFSFIKNMVEGGLKRLVVMGTMHEVGYWEGEINENTPCSPLSLYGIAKNTLRQSVMQLNKTKDFSLAWLRAFYIVGDDTKNHSIFSKIIQMENEHKEQFPFTSGKNLYDFIDVNQLAKMIAKTSVSVNENGIINVCSGKPVSLANKVMEFIEEHNYKIRPLYGAFPDREYDSPGIWGNSERIEKIMSEVIPENK